MFFFKIPLNSSSFFIILFVRNDKKEIKTLYMCKYFCTFVAKIN